MAENDLDEGEEKKSSKKMIIIVAAVVLLLAGGGGGYYFMASEPTADGEEVEEDVELELEEEDEVEGENEEIYYDMKQSLIVNFPKGSSASLIQVSISLLVKGEKAVEALKKHEPMIRNNLLMAISAKGSDNLRTAEGKEALRDEMLKEVSKVMRRMTKKDKVENVFFTAFVMQ